MDKRNKWNAKRWYKSDTPHVLLTISYHLYC